MCMITSNTYSTPYKGTLVHALNQRVHTYLQPSYLVHLGWHRVQCDCLALLQAIWIPENVATIKIAMSVRIVLNLVVVCFVHNLASHMYNIATPDIYWISIIFCSTVSPYFY